jgi:molybdenum-dependent DNA-binding transcriptional regulator ModE
MAGRERRRRKVRRFTAERRARFLEHLRRTGNQGAAAKAVGIHRDNVEKRRKRDAEFAIACIAAEEEVARRLAGAGDPFDADAVGAFETIRRGRGGRPQIVATRTGKWTKAREGLFLDAIRQCGNVAASARAVGMSESSVWTRRREWPGFRAKMEEALEEAEVVLEFRLATFGNNVGAGREEDGTVAFPNGGAPANGEDEKRDCPPFDPEFALRFLKWRDEKRHGRGRRGRSGGYLRREPSIEEVRDEVLRRIEAIRRHRQEFGTDDERGDGEGGGGDAHS